MFCSRKRACETLGFWFQCCGYGWSREARDLAVVTNLWLIMAVAGTRGVGLQDEGPLSTALIPRVQLLLTKVFHDTAKNERGQKIWKLSDGRGRESSDTQREQKPNETGKQVASRDDDYRVVSAARYCSFSVHKQRNNGALGGYLLRTLPLSPSVLV